MMAVYNSGRGERVVSAGIGVGMPSSRREIEEDILEELCHMAQRRSCLGVGDISEVLKISEKELSYYLRQMKRHGYVELSPEGTSVCLTELGRITGAECGYRHEILHSFCSLSVWEVKPPGKMPAVWSISSARRRSGRFAIL